MIPPGDSKVTVKTAGQIVRLITTRSRDIANKAENADRYHANDAVSAVRIRAALIDTPSSISVITREMMDDLAPNRVFDVTRYIAGVQEGRGLNFQDRQIIRGFETTTAREAAEKKAKEEAEKAAEGK